MQRFDIFFKRIFSEYANELLKLLNIILNIDCGASVKQELPVEIVKGALRVDKIVKTDSDKILLIDFEEIFTLDAYFEMVVHIHAHIRATRYYRILLEEDTTETNYIPVILSIRYNKKHMSYLQKHKVIQRIADGLYYTRTTPFGSFFILVLSELNILRYMLRTLGYCKTEEVCERLSEKISMPETWEQMCIDAREDTELKKILKTLISMYGELFIFTKFDFRYMLSVWRFARVEVKNRAKVILDALLLLFRKEASRMNVSKLLTKSEKKEIIEALGVKEAVEAVGIKNVIEEVGLERVIEEVGIERVIEEVGLENVIEEAGLERVIEKVGLERVIEEVGIERVIDTIGVEKVIDTIAKREDLLDENERRALLEILKKIREKKRKTKR